MEFIASTRIPDTKTDKAYYFIIGNNKILTQGSEIPCIKLTQVSSLPVASTFFFGTYNNTPCYCAPFIQNEQYYGSLKNNFDLISLRQFYHVSNEQFRQMAGCARQIVDLHTHNRFCGACGGQTHILDGEHARTCPTCDITTYPRISPAIMAAVTRGDEILLARGVNFPNQKMFSILAGFVSPAETLEDCVRREVLEETGIKVGKIQYANSQPWPFPDSLMIGFTAQYQSGDIRIDPEEISEAAWFKANNLPLIPNEYSLAGQLIREFIRKHTD